ncbi:MAG: GNAT family N-acetyltransferase [Dehalococcoidales bacterium]|nr:GNAT family N-acetyltransferase [Dehalococcoidales bacterium]
MNRDITVLPEDFDSLSSLYSRPESGLKWDPLFVLPAWIKTWWRHFGGSADTWIRSVWLDKKIIGIAPLQIRQGTASITGSVDVCDYQDFVVVPGYERYFFAAILDELLREGVSCLDLETIRPDSSIAVDLVPLAREREYKVEYQQIDVSADMPIPSGWDEYLGTLDGKQRHEIKRKMRNLQRIGETSYRHITDLGDIQESVEVFLRMFPESRGDKARFMTDEMQSFFRSLSTAMAEAGVLRFGILQAGHKPVAMVMLFDYNESIYLYNSAYDPAFRSMSVGIISKAMCIQESIKLRKRRFDFLKGAELYKQHLGGKEIPLFRCRLTLR